MIIGINPNRPIRYVLACERDADGKPKPDATVWLLRSLKPDVHADLVGGLHDFKAMAKTQLRALREGLTGWENFRVRGEDGAPVEAVFKANSDGHPTDETIEMIPPQHRSELGSAVLEAAEVTPDEKKG